MAKRITIPYIVREVSYRLEQMLGLQFGVPMSYSVPFFPPNEGEEKSGKVVVHFPGHHFVARVVTGRGWYGQEVGILSVRCKLALGTVECEKFVEMVQRYAGPFEMLEWHSSFNMMSGVKFSLDHKQIGFLGAVASWKRNEGSCTSMRTPKIPFMR